MAASGASWTGCRRCLSIEGEELQFQLDRRRPGQSRITTPRNEADACEILSGVGPDGVTLGTPVAVLVRNKDQRSQDYGEIAWRSTVPTRTRRTI